MKTIFMRVGSSLPITCMYQVCWTCQSAPYKFRHHSCFFKQTDNYTYLGQTITSNGKCDDAILKIIEIARGAFNSMLKTITARHIIMKTRKIIKKAYVWSTLLYGCETWTITNRNMKNCNRLKCGHIGS